MKCGQRRPSGVWVNVSGGRAPKRLSDLINPANRYSPAVPPFCQGRRRGARPVQRIGERVSEPGRLSEGITAERDMLIGRLGRARRNGIGAV